ncbi:MAG: endonuclease domain-containing protein [Marinoscillum sp.]
MTEQEMFYGASSDIFQKARELRENMTESERLLWNQLKQNQLLGLRFKPQHPIGHFIADFYCHQLKLVIEIDGEYHSSMEQKEYDNGRDYEMEELEIVVMRINSEIVLNDPKLVLKSIENKCNELLNGSTL